ncbi:MAG: hypothetical protein QM504_17700 [Pseudomonadota bacterium]
MHAIEFEVDSKNNIIEIPSQYKEYFSKHLKVTALLYESFESKSVPSKEKYDFSDVAGKLEWSGDAVQEQRKIRDEW